MNSELFLVLPFTNDNLAKSLSNHLVSEAQVKVRMPFKFFSEYLGNVNDGLDAKTIVIENKYVSKSYLNDFSNYYSTCFSEYDRFCKRVHFFSNSFTLKQFKAVLKNPRSSLSTLWNSYLGYIVVKPLPLLSIGATLIKTYSTNSLNKRRFPVTKEYPVNLFGKELKINSLAFQEQDSVVGACASSALWSAFHKTSQLFQTPLPSPSDITKSAKNLFQNSGRTYPNGGLDYYQIGNAIEAVGLVSELRNSDKFTDIGYLKSFIYAYNKMGLPVLIGLDFGNGRHLITITGYKEESVMNFPRTPNMSLKASKLERLYAHDDQVGPFSRLGFNAKGEFITSWWDDASGSTKKTAALVSLFIPLNQKIRLTFENIYSKVRLVDLYFFQRLASMEVYWDIYLDFSNNYKKELHESTLAILPELKYSLLTETMPKYVWIAKGCIDDECLIEFIFDATEIATADYCMNINVYNDSLKTLLKADLSIGIIKDFFYNNLGAAFYQLLVKSSS